MQKYDHVTGYLLNVLHWFLVRQHVQYRVASLVWRCHLGLAPAYLMDLCRPVSGARGSRSLRSAERGVLVVPFARTVAMPNCAFSVAGPRAWNYLPQELRLFSRLGLCTDTFPGHLKTQGLCVPTPFLKRKFFCNVYFEGISYFRTSTFLEV